MVLNTMYVDLDANVAATLSDGGELESNMVTEYSSVVHNSGHSSPSSPYNLYVEHIQHACTLPNLARAMAD